MGLNPSRYIQDDRQFNAGQGNNLNQQQQDQANNWGTVGSYYRSYGDEVYDPLIGGRGGYSAGEQTAISGQPGAGRTTPDEEAGNFLTDDERAGITGNPDSQYRFFNPNDDAARQANSEEAQRGAVSQLDAGLHEGITPDLGVSDEYSRGVGSTLADTQGRVRGAIDPDRLRADPGALDTIRMSPEEKQAIITGAGISAGQGYRATIGELERNARAAGADPLGVAAARGRYERDASAAAGDAETQARIAADTAEADRAAQAEGIRQQGEDTYAGLSSSNEMQLGTQALNANQEKENTRLAAAQDVSNRRMNAAATAGQARIGSEEAINSQGRQQAQFDTTTGTQIAKNVDDTKSGRVATVATNRQSTGEANQDRRFAQGYAVDSANSDRAKAIADERLKEAQEGRGYLQSQQQLANQNQQAAYNRQAGLYSTQGQLQQGNTGQAMQQDNKPKWWEKALGAGMSAAGAIAGA